jgi:YegS/Rv2252/BmrU family lipid kinase
MTSVAVVAHQGKSFDGGLDELRDRLTDAGIDDPLWFEVPKSRKAPARALEAVKNGADLIFVWGGDGMVQRCVDALAGKPVTIAILPAGTANLLASNLGVPKSLARAVEVGLRGHRRSLDVGVVNGERFAVMAGAGFDALMIRDADAGLKDKAGRLAYVWTGARNLGAEAVKTRIRVDGRNWFKGRASCVLVGNVGTISGGFTAFADAQPDDGHLDLGVVTAKGALQWSRVLARLATGKLERSPFTRDTSAHKIAVEFDHKVTYELDGGARRKTKRLKVRIEPSAITVAVPDETAP